MKDAEQPEQVEQPVSATAESVTDPTDAPDAPDAADAAATASTPRRRPRLTWGLLVPVVMASAGVMFAMSLPDGAGPGPPGRP